MNIGKTPYSSIKQITVNAGDLQTCAVDNGYKVGNKETTFDNICKRIDKYKTISL